MTVIIPPRMSQTGLEHLLDHSRPVGNLLRASWVISQGRLKKPAGARKTPDTAQCKPAPTVGSMEPSEMHAAIMAEMGPRITTSRNGSDWRLHLDGTQTAPITQPSLPDVATAVGGLVKEPLATRAGLRGQRDWVAIYFARLLGFQPGSHAAVLDLLDCAVNLAMGPTFALKNGAKIPRPLDVDPTLEEVVERLWHASWPSGHAAAAYTIATVLGRLTGADAAEQERLDELADMVAVNREKALVHTPLDSNAGRMVGQAVGQWLADSATTGCKTHPTWASLWEAARQQL